MVRIINSLYIVFSLAKLKQKKNKVESINHLMKNLYGVDDFIALFFVYSHHLFLLWEERGRVYFYKKYTMTTALRQINNIK